ncbi:MAG: hypothetical protein IPN71_10955 [Fibrobacteres bacterium]|nr:hypothetical protein [Fibrobacterota bacterium]
MAAPKIIFQKLRALCTNLYFLMFLAIGLPFYISYKLTHSPLYSHFFPYRIPVELHRHNESPSQSESINRRFSSKKDATFDTSRSLLFPLLIEECARIVQGYEGAFFSYGRHSKKDSSIKILTRLDSSRQEAYSRCKAYKISQPIPTQWPEYEGVIDFYFFEMPQSCDCISEPTLFTSPSVRVTVSIFGNNIKVLGSQKFLNETLPGTEYLPFEDFKRDTIQALSLLQIFQKQRISESDSIRLKTYYSKHCLINRPISSNVLQRHPEFWKWVDCWRK